MIRRAAPADLSEVVRMGRRHFAASGLPGEFDADALRAFAERLIEGGVILMSEDGMIGGTLSPVFCAPSRVLAVELFWSAEDGRGRDLLAAFEAWAWAAGASEIRMSAVVGHRGEAVGRLLRLAGYAPVETSYGKAI